ncbi:MAG: hypothetical protein J0I77_04205 [Rudaea sp.]|uniref:hypothetical protein n=1 Tax=unclassified Rudaea TaxID=2627037 RepID=UPI001AC31D1D|nr:MULTISPECIES: hypothetical protein [unclassified Rudaea]MBN8884895.1 hypothetical protein [Rudaea sp.]MBR0344659.1 hypothetical protein [Rudaea sp.]
MPSYRLQLLIDKEVLPIIKGAGQRITLAKPVNSSSPNVIWQSIDPFVSTEVQWDEQYGIYASTVQMTDGATITKMSETDIPAVDGAYYSFTSATVFTGPFGGGSVPKGSYKANNDVPFSSYPALTFGLTQTALINQQPADRKPISATPVLATQSAMMTPFTNIYIWLQSTFKSETIITQITGNYSVAKFGGSVTDLVLKYDPNLGIFAPASKGTALLQEDSELVTLHTNLLH